MESVRLTTSDGHTLEADIVTASGDGRQRGGVVICHPHPQYGGDRFNPVVGAMFRHLPTIGFTSLRFDFRGAFGGGVDERCDVVAALDELSTRLDGPVHLAGYSFGAAVALSTHDDRVERIVAIAPPLAMMDVATPGVPALVLVPRHDQFSPPDVVEPVVDTWPDAEAQVIESVDHFLLGRAHEVAERAGRWLADASDH